MVKREEHIDPVVCCTCNGSYEQDVTEKAGACGVAGMGDVWRRVPSQTVFGSTLGGEVTQIFVILIQCVT